MKYSNYRNSDAWFGQHEKWLKASKNRCQLFPWVRVGKINRKYHKYNIHHLHRNAYRRQNKEKWNRDVIVLCPFAHKLVFHWLLSGGKKTVSEQKDFPNTQQRVFNWYCRFVGIAVNVPASIWLTSIMFFIGYVFVPDLIQQQR